MKTTKQFIIDTLVELTIWSASAVGMLEILKLLL